MNHFSLLANLYILSTQPSQPMHVPQKKSESSCQRHISLEEIHKKDTKHIQKGVKPQHKT